jgi:hypothetical protein
MAANVAQVSAVISVLPEFILPSGGGLKAAIHAAAYATPAGLITILAVSLFRKEALMLSAPRSCKRRRQCSNRTNGIGIHRRFADSGETRKTISWLCPPLQNPF